MPMVRVSDGTHKRLVERKRRGSTIDDVIQRLLFDTARYYELTRGGKRGRSSVEADRTPDR
jgi:hypothetical protein